MSKKTYNNKGNKKVNSLNLETAVPQGKGFKTRIGRLKWNLTVLCDLMENVVFHLLPLCENRDNNGYPPMFSGGPKEII